MTMNFESTTPKNEKDNARTPRWFIKSVEDFFCMEFNLDVCASEETAKCQFYYSKEFGDDGLDLSWRDFNWCNPPFSDVPAWINKAADEAYVGRTTVMIFPDKPETHYVRLAAKQADTIVRMPFRLKFLRPDGSEFLDKNGKPQGPTFPVLLAYFTPLGLKAPTRFMYHDFREGFK